LGKKVRKMQTLAKTDIADIDELQGLSNRSLPVREQRARQYIKESFTGKMPSIIPFSLRNESIIKLASYLLKYTTGSKYTLYQYVFGIRRFCKLIKKEPDEIIEELRHDRKLYDTYIGEIDAFIGDLEAENLTPGTISNYVKAIKALFRTNGIGLSFPHRLPRRIVCPDRAPNPEELRKLIEIADIREKVIISFLVLGGFRVGTLVKLEYRHVKNDLQAGIVPIHVHVEAEITKGKYGDYDTFLGLEAVEYLKAYLVFRRNGTDYISSEDIKDSSPIIRNERTKEIKPISPGAIHRIMGRLYGKTNLRRKVGRKCVRYDLRVHSLRKFFRTQLGSKISTECVEYMMGHKLSTYNDMQMKGIEFLRGIYAGSGFSIRPKTQLSKIDQIKIMIEAWGMDPNKILSKEALAMPHRTVIDPERRQIDVLNQALKQAIIKELQESTKAVYRTVQDGSPEETLLWSYIYL
jgi:integrase